MISEPWVVDTPNEQSRVEPLGEPLGAMDPKACHATDATGVLLTSLGSEGLAVKRLNEEGSPHARYPPRSFNLMGLLLVAARRSHGLIMAWRRDD